MFWSIPISDQETVTLTPIGVKSITHIFFEDKGGKALDHDSRGLATVSVSIDGKQILQDVPVVPFCTSSLDGVHRHSWEKVALEVNLNVDMAEVKISPGREVNDFAVVFVTSDAECDMARGFDYVETRSVTLKTNVDAEAEEQVTRVLHEARANARTWATWQDEEARSQAWLAHAKEYSDQARRYVTDPAFPVVGFNAKTFVAQPTSVEQVAAITQEVNAFLDRCRVAYGKVKATSDFTEEMYEIYAPQVCPIPSVDASTPEEEHELLKPWYDETLKPWAQSFINLYGLQDVTAEDEESTISVASCKAYHDKVYIAACNAMVEYIIDQYDPFVWWPESETYSRTATSVPDNGILADWPTIASKAWQQMLDYQNQIRTPFAYEAPAGSLTISGKRFPDTAYDAWCMTTKQPEGVRPPTDAGNMTWDVTLWTEDNDTTYRAAYSYVADSDGGFADTSDWAQEWIAAGVKKISTAMDNRLTAANGTEQMFRLQRAPMRFVAMSVGHFNERLDTAGSAMANVDIEASFELTSDVAEAMPRGTDLRLYCIKDGVPYADALHDFEDGTMTRNVRCRVSATPKPGSRTVNLREQMLTQMCRVSLWTKYLLRWDIIFLFIYKKLI